MPPPEDESGGCSYGSVKRWSKKVKSAGGCVFKLDKLIVPVNVSNSHWCLAVAHVRERRLQYYDSMGGQGRRYPGGLRLFLQGEAKKYNGDAGVDVANWEVVPTQVWGPRRCGAHAGELLASQQHNCDDCGVFTCIFSNYVSAALPFVFTAATSVSASPSAH